MFWWLATFNLITQIFGNEFSCIRIWLPFNQSCDKTLWMKSELMLLCVLICVFFYLFLACPNNCLTCAPGTDGVMVCTACKALFILNAGDCGACPRYCQTCSESTTGMICNQCQNRTIAMPDASCQRAYIAKLIFSSMWLVCCCY